jgi:hypothetical protein
VLFSEQFTQKDDEEAKASKRTAAQRRPIIQNPAQGGPGWGDDRGVPQWSKWIMAFVNKKTCDLAKPEFDKHSGNWLLVYDNLPVPFARDTPKRWTDLGDRLRGYFAGVSHYDIVFIDSANELAEFTSAGHLVQPIVDLWRQDESSWSPP